MATEKKIKWWIPVLIIVALAGMGVAAYFLVLKNKKENTPVDPGVEKTDPCRGYPRSYRKGGYIYRETCVNGNISVSKKAETRATEAQITNAPIPVGGLI